MNKRTYKKQLKNNIRLLDRAQKTQKREAIYNLAHKRVPTAKDIALYNMWTEFDWKELH